MRGADQIETVETHYPRIGFDPTVALSHRTAGQE
jgi:hypothetical protein